MKKILYFALIAAVAAIASCKKDSGPTTAEFKISSSTSLHEFQSGDKVGLFSDNKLSVLTATSAGKTATFTGLTATADPTYAFFPCTGSETVANAVLKMAINETQAGEGHPASENVLSAAVVSGTTFSLKPAAGFIKFTLTREDIHSVTFEAENIAGAVDVTIADKNTVKVTAGKAAVTVTPAGGDKFAKGDCYAVVVPQTYDAGILVTIADEFGRVATKKIEDLTSIKVGETLDLGEYDSDIEFVTPRIFATPANLAFSGDGETKNVEVASAFTGTPEVQASTWLSASVSGSSISVTAAANPSDKFKRFGTVVINGVTAEGPVELVIPAAQGAKGSVVYYDSFQQAALDENVWKGDMMGVSLLGNNVEEGSEISHALRVEGLATSDSWPSGGEMGHPIFFDQFIRWANGASDPLDFNNWEFSFDFLANQAHVGGILFNQTGYTGGSYIFNDAQNYNVYMAAQEGSTDGAFYFCFNMGGPSAMDPYTPSATPTKWVRFKVTNRNLHDYADGDEVRPDGTDWTYVSIWSLEEKDGGLVEKDMLFHKCMWTWNDNPTVFRETSRNQGGRFGIYVNQNDAFPVGYFRNFCISNTNKF